MLETPVEDLPPELQEAMLAEIEAQREADEARREKALEMVDALGASLLKKRDEAVQGRAALGIEQEWIEDEESYEGIDEANRGSKNVRKPVSPNGAFTTRTKAKQPARSTAVLNITKPYVDSASARLADMLLPTDDLPFSFKATPIPSMVKSPEIAQAIQAVGGQGAPGPMTAPGVMPVQPTGAEFDPDTPTPEFEQATKSAKGAEKQVADWLVQSRWHSQVRLVLDDCAKLGTGVLKGPIPMRKTRRAAVKQNGVMAIIVKNEIRPTSQRVDPWLLYPDPACGENIHNGGYIWELDSITPKKLRELKDMQEAGYLPEQIDKVLKQGPQNKKGDPSNRASQDTSDNFDIWYFHGNIGRKDLEAAGVKFDEGSDPDEEVELPAVITMVNDTPIRAALNPLDSGEFPYDVMCWKRRKGMWCGMGVAREINTPQRMLTAGVRNMLDNAGLSAGPQLVIDRTSIEPADGVWTITPRKIWWMKAGGQARTVAEAFAAFNIPTMQQELLNIIQFALQMAEQVTGMPMLLQGQTGGAPETYGGMVIVNNNAGTLLRRLARTYDDCITEPQVTRYYEWLLMYGKDDSIKGDFEIDAQGSTALIERSLESQAIVQMGEMVQNPAFEIDPAKWFREMCKAQRIDPKRLTLDPAKKQEQATAPPPPDPQVVRAETQKEIAEMTLQDKQADREFQERKQDKELAHKGKALAYNAQREQSEYTIAMTNAEITRVLGMLELQTDSQNSEADRALKERLEMIKIDNQRQIFTAEQMRGTNVAAGV
jgi:hypothetical protein